MNLESLKKVVSEALEVSAEQLKSETCLDDLDGYDSIKVLTLMVSLDDVGVVISQTEAANMKTYGDIETLAKAKLGLA